MPTFEFTHPQTGQKIQMIRPTPPTEMEIDAEFARAGHVDTAIPAAPSMPTFTGSPGAGFRGAPSTGGRASGAGPGGQNFQTGRGSSVGQNIGIPSTPPEPMMGFKQALKEEAPYIAANAATMGFSTFASPFIRAGIPALEAAIKAYPLTSKLVGLGTRAGVAATAAGGTKAVQNTMDNKPLTEGVGETSFYAGALPEVVGSTLAAGTGYATRKVGNLRARWNAPYKNNKFMEKTVNPQGLNVGQAGTKVGREIRQTAGANAEAARTGLEQQYEQQLSGPFGQARKLKIEEGEPSDFTMNDQGQMTAIPEAPPMDFSITESGPSIAQLHNRLSTKQAAARKAGPAVPRTAQSPANLTFDRMKGIAEQHGFTMDEYTQLGNAWREMLETHYNPQMAEIAKSKDADIIDLLASPRKWKSMQVKAPNGTKQTIDAPGMLAMLKENVGPELWPRVQAAVGKRIIFNAKTNGVLDPKRLGEAVKQLTVYRVDKKLIHGAQDLADLAKVVEQGTKDPKLPYATHGQLDLTNLTALSNWALQKGGLETPDAKRMIAQMRGKRGVIEKAVRILTKIGTYAAASQVNDPEDPIFDIGADAPDNEPSIPPAPVGGFNRATK